MTHERPEKASSIPSADPPPNLDAVPASKAEPVDRQEMIRRYTEDASERDSPLAANLVVLNSDLLQIAATVAESLKQPRRPSLARPEHFYEYARRAELFMKLARQVDRFAQLDRQLSQGNG